MLNSTPLDTTSVLESGASLRRSSTACRKLTPSAFMTKSMTLPPAPQPRQWKTFFFGLTTKLGVLSSWKGQRPRRLSSPDFLKATPFASASRRTLTSRFSRSNSTSGTRAIPASLQNLSRASAVLPVDSKAVHAYTR